jgi:hypothetical protein
MVMLIWKTIRAKRWDKGGEPFGVAVGGDQVNGLFDF